MRTPRTVVAQTLGGTFEIGYERLVVALGAARTFAIPGLAEHGHGFKDIADAIALRNRSCGRSSRPLRASIRGGRARPWLCLRRCWLRRRRGAARAGTSRGTPYGARTRRSGPSDSGGCSWTGPADPLRDPAEARRVHAPLPRKRGSRSTSALRSSRSTSARRCSPTGRGSPPGHSSGRQVSGRAPICERLGLPLDERGRVVVGPTLQVEGADDVWALGDGAAVPNTRTPGRSTRPPASTRFARPDGWRRT